jgi:hypothetical protein
MIPKLDVRRLHTILTALYGVSRKRPESPLEWLRQQFENLNLPGWRKQT